MQFTGLFSRERSNYLHGNFVTGSSFEKATLVERCGKQVSLPCKAGPGLQARTRLIVTIRLFKLLFTLSTVLLAQFGKSGKFELFQACKCPCTCRTWACTSPDPLRHTAALRAESLLSLGCLFDQFERRDCSLLTKLCYRICADGLCILKTSSANTFSLKKKLRSWLDCRRNPRLSTFFFGCPKT